MAPVTDKRASTGYPRSPTLSLAMPFPQITVDPHRALHAITHADIPLACAPSQDPAAQRLFGIDLAQNAWKLFAREGCLIEFAGIDDINSEELVRQQRNLQQRNDFTDVQAGHSLIAGIANMLLQQSVPGQTISNREHAYTVAATLCMDRLWKAEADELQPLGTANGIELPTLPSVLAIRITPLRDGTGWRLNKLMQWHSYTDEDGRTHCMSNLSPVLTIDHQIEFDCDSADPLFTRMTNWVTGKEPQNVELGNRSDIVHVACSDPRLDAALTTERHAGGSTLARLLSAILAALSDAFDDLFDSCRRRDGVAYKRVSRQESEPFECDRPHAIGCYRSDEAEAGQSLTPIQLNAIRELDPTMLVFEPYHPTNERHYIARRTDKGMNGVGRYRFEPCDMHHVAMKQQDLTQGWLPSIMDVLYRSRGMERPASNGPASRVDDRNAAPARLNDDGSEDASLSNDGDFAGGGPEPSELVAVDSQLDASPQNLSFRGMAEGLIPPPPSDAAIPFAHDGALPPSNNLPIPDLDGDWGLISIHRGEEDSQLHR